MPTICPENCISAKCKMINRALGLPGVYELLLVWRLDQEIERMGGL